MFSWLQGDDGSQDVATSLANAAAAAIAAAQQSQPNPCVTQNSDSITCVVPSSLHGTSAGQNVNKQHPDNTPKRLHVSNIPFRFRDPDLRNMFGVSIFMYFPCIFCDVQWLLNVISRFSKSQSWTILETVILTKLYISALSEMVKMANFSIWN